MTPDSNTIESVSQDFADEVRLDIVLLKNPWSDDLVLKVVHISSLISLMLSLIQEVRERVPLGCHCTLLKES